MSLTLYFHPLSSYCQKVLMALYENGTPFTPLLVNLGDPVDVAAFKKLWPIGKFPVLRDEARNLTVPESTPIIDYLDRYYPGPTRFVPADADTAFETRAKDRFFDLHIHVHMQKIVTDRLRPPANGDAFGVDHARAALATALGLLDAELASRRWAVGDTFTLSDCAAAPALYYVNMAVMPLAAAHKHVATYLERLMQRPCYARALAEAKPYLDLVPK